MVPNARLLVARRVCPSFSIRSISSRGVGFYKLLEVDEYATQEEIKKAYFQKARKHKCKDCDTGYYQHGRRKDM